MHISVLLKETIETLDLKENDIAVDCTLGYAGHSSAILKKIKKGHLYAFDQDMDAINYSQNVLKEIGSNYTIIHSNFQNIKEKLAELNIFKVDKILFDLGVSSPQLDNEERGFSYQKDGLLDMRMDTQNELNAHIVVNTYSLEDLTRIFREYGEEKYAYSIAKKIVKVRETATINTTLELSEIIKSSVPSAYKRDKHPAKKVFQALRIEVNQELDVLKKALEDAISMLNINGKIVVITFHSLEDKICKEIFKKYTEVPKELRKMAFLPPNFEVKFKTGKNILPNTEEINNNNRSRSAKLRIIERIRG